MPVDSAQANRQARFGLQRKDAHFQNLLMVYAWNVSGPEPELFALTYAEALALLDERGHLKTHSWKELGVYVLTVHDAWREGFQPYRMQPEQWAAKIVTTIRSKSIGT